MGAVWSLKLLKGSWPLAAGSRRDGTQKTKPRSKEPTDHGIENLTVTAMITGTGTPFTIVGVNFH